MKTKHIFLSVLIASSGFAFTACDDYLDEVPEASISRKYILQRQPTFKPLQIICTLIFFPLTELGIHTASTKMMQQRTIK